MKPINEVGRAVVELPADTTFYSSPMYLAIAFEAASERPEPLLLTRGTTKSLGYQAAYELIGYTLCGDRAQRAVDQSLVVDGKSITPEAYLGLWRTAIKEACTPGGLLRLHGIRLIAQIAGPVDLIPRCRSPWTTAPFQSLAESKYARNLPISDGQFALRIDLCERDAARDAFYISEMVTVACRDEHPCSAAILLEGAAAIPTTADLFAPAPSLVEA